MANPSLAHLMLNNLSYHLILNLKVCGSLVANPSPKWGLNQQPSSSNVALTLTKYAKRQVPNPYNFWQLLNSIYEFL